MNLWLNGESRTRKSKPKSEPWNLINTFIFTGIKGDSNTLYKYSENYIWCISGYWSWVLKKNVFVSRVPGLCQALPTPNFNEKHIDVCCFVQVTHMLRGIFSFSGPPSKCPVSFSICDLKNFTFFYWSLFHISQALLGLGPRFTFSFFLLMISLQKPLLVCIIHFTSSLEFPAPVPSFSNDSN